MQQAQSFDERRWQEVVLPLCAGQRLALCVLRRAGEGQVYCSLADIGGNRRNCRELAGIMEMFAPLLKAPSAASYLRAVRLGLPGCAAITKDERRLLNAIAAAQTGDEALVDNYLYRLALERRARGSLATAAMRLAAWLAVNGYWLPGPAGAVAMPVPAGALTVARHKGFESHDMAVAWPVG